MSVLCMLIASGTCRVALCHFRMWVHICGALGVPSGCAYKAVFALQCVRIIILFDKCVLKIETLLIADQRRCPQTSTQLTTDGLMTVPAGWLTGGHTGWMDGLEILGRQDGAWIGKTIKLSIVKRGRRPWKLVWALC